MLAAWDPDPGLFIAGRVLQGGCTSMMLIAAVPPLVVGWPTSKMPVTGVTMNMCIFGAVALGPVIGGVQAGSGGWHTLFGLVAGTGGLALVFSLATFEDEERQDAVFALIELLRGVAAFMIAPILLHVSMTVAGSPQGGISVAMWACFGLACAGGLIAVQLVALGRARLQAPDLERWGQGEEPAWESPPLAAGLRGRSRVTRVGASG